MDFDRHRTEIVTQTELLAADLKDADLRAPVPSCPGWSLGDLVRHIGGGHRWATEIVRTRATGCLPDEQVRKLDGDDSGPLPADWLVEGAGRFADTLRTAARTPRSGPRSTTGPTGSGRAGSPTRPSRWRRRDVETAWFVDLTGDAVAWRRGSGHAAARVRAPLTDLLLLIYRRTSLRDHDIDISGDRRLLERWHDAIGFG